MPSQKRPLDSGASARKAKKTKLSSEGKTRNEPRLQSSSNVVSAEIDFPRGGGTSFTPIEVKTIRAEAVKEANKELFADTEVPAKKSKLKSVIDAAGLEKGHQIRVEHLNYKRMTIGMKILGQVVSVQPLALIVSLPNQLFGHVPITQISSQLTSLLEAMEEDEEGGNEETQTFKSCVPDLSEIFHPGQYIRSVVTAVHAPGSTNMTGIGRPRDEVAKVSRRVELSLVPEKVNGEIHKSDLRPGFTLSAAIKSVEDHGYILDLGVPDVSGFLSFKNAKNGPYDSNTKFHVGQLVDATVTKVSGKGRIFNISVDSESFLSSSLSEVTSATSVLPGCLVQSLITAAHPAGLNLQVLGFFEGTIDQFHLHPDTANKAYKMGTKIKTRVMYDIPGTPPRFALSLADHVLSLSTRNVKVITESSTSPSIQENFPVGTILDEVKIVRVETERGLVVKIQPGLEGFIHISNVSDEHTPSLSPSSGPWKLGTIHRARVTGYFSFDGLLQLSLKPSVLHQKFLQVADVHVGQLVKGTVKKLTDAGLFVSLSGSLDGVIWPNHYSDIALKHPSKRFKVGGHVKCRVLVVDSEHKRIVLTAKKTLLDSDLPILCNFEDVRVGVVTHAVVLKVFEKNLVVEFYNKLQASVPAREASEADVGKLSEHFTAGRVVNVRIISVDANTSRISASIRQAAPNFKPHVTDITGVEVGNIMEGLISQIHSDNVILTLQPSGARAILSLNNLANHRGSTVLQLRGALKVDEKLEDLVVVSRNPEKGFVIVANRPQSKALSTPKQSLSINTIEVGQVVVGRVIRHGRNGAFIKLSSHLGGTLHPTDASDNYEAGVPFPVVDSIQKAVVIEIDAAKKHVTLSTRGSRIFPEHGRTVADREINDVGELNKGETIRGFIKSVAEPGLFVTLGRDVDARVQIKELFDEYVKDWKSRFEANQLIKGRILSVDLEQKKVEMTFRSGDLTRDTTASLSLADLFEGQKVDGFVKKIEDYGLFIQIEGSKVSGLCHKSQLSDNKMADVTLALRSFREGDRVRAIILDIDRERRRISFGLKPSHFADADVGENEATEAEADEPESEPLGVVKEDDDLLDVDPPRDDVVMSDIVTDDSDDEASENMQFDLDSQSQWFQQRPVGPSSGTVLKLQGGFQWSGNNPHSEDEAGSDSSSDESLGKNQTSRKKKRRRKEIEQDLTANMHTKTPESNADFERLLLGSPDSSYLWVQYMSFQLQLSEVEKGREIGRRALQTINFREEQEKLNVWIAMLNLENVYGTDETLEATFKDAARHNDSKTIHLRLAVIFDQTEKHEKAEEQYKRTTKRFGQSSKAWTTFGEYYLRRGDVEEARKLLPRSLQSLDKRKHLKTISKFAQLEYKLGDPERGKTIFEGIVDSHPKRWDLWSIYMDMEASQNAIHSLRNLFVRVFANKMTSHKAKSFFKKWFELERRLGDEEGVATVKQKAIEWTQKATSSS